MTAPVWGLSPELPPVPVKSVYRYLGMGRAQPDPAVAALVEECMPAFVSAARCRACYAELPVQIEGETVDFGGLQADSASLAKNLSGCRQAILFAATLGAQEDLLCRRAGVDSPARALVLDAMGSAAIEALCDTLCDGWARENPGLRLRPRFSPGYGDLPLDFQVRLLAFLDSGRKAGITLSETLLMVPQKSVSAIVGLGENGCTARFHDCGACEKKDCAFRL